MTDRKGRRRRAKLAKARNRMRWMTHETIRLQLAVALGHYIALSHPTFKGEFTGFAHRYGGSP